MLRLPARLLTPRFAVLHLGENCLHGASLALVEMKASINVPVWTKAEVSAASRAAVSTNCDSTEARPAAALVRRAEDTAQRGIGGENGGVNDIIHSVIIDGKQDSAIASPDSPLLNAVHVTPPSLLR
jgi:hypothetical protein